MATPKWSTWANTAGSTKFLELHDLVVNRSLSPVFGPMTSSDLNYIIKTIHKSILRKNPNNAQDVYNYLLERNVWRYCFVKNKDFNVEHPRYPFQRVCSNPGTSRRASCCQGSCSSSSRSNNSSNKCCTPPSAPPPRANDGANSSGPSKPRGKHPVSNPNVMTAEDRAKMTACENLAAATQAIKK
ncbi:uncharacterized protein EAE97_005095 [Botrytis byssoidea]|uniref:Uncharacterized protein n=1 Tax=Botrytis byssoidea TaxID=139641 RepID=A0A9P5M7E2_9HELO|nr:uncharacterized protein EAE97_005095 [Botrytis byssoidea]KAF7946057.1 hypothetical protein EAE97_005095 [Botrytis byssoidea]